MATLYATRYGTLSTATATRATNRVVLPKTAAYSRPTQPPSLVSLGSKSKEGSRRAEGTAASQVGRWEKLRLRTTLPAIEMCTTLCLLRQTVRPCVVERISRGSLEDDIEQGKGRLIGLTTAKVEASHINLSYVENS